MHICISLLYHILLILPSLFGIHISESAVNADKGNIGIMLRNFKKLFAVKCVTAKIKRPSLRPYNKAEGFNRMVGKDSRYFKIANRDTLPYTESLCIRFTCFFPRQQKYFDLLYICLRRNITVKRYQRNLPEVHKSQRGCC